MITSKHLFLSSVLCMLSCCFVLNVSEAREQKSTSGNSGGRLLITGSSTMCPMIDAMGKRFETLHHDVSVEVECGGSERGVKDILEGKADIGMISRSLKDSERDLYGFPVARDGISIIVNKENPVMSLSNAQIVGIFTGAITDWEEVQGPKEKILVVLREPQKSSTELFRNYFKLKERQMTGIVFAGDNPVTIKAVASNRRAIGYVSSGFALHQEASGVLIKVLPVNDVKPTRRNIITVNYPISRPLLLISAKFPTGFVKEFIDFALSSGNVDIIEMFNYIPYED
jgi:phosphate transport system substrate-binding protein